ncbi:MAG: isoprenylcysteine carboxylmethyltransferase family protein [Rickettsiales bacterium]|nr:isoprenylcysteine carboxylmethyltransferase family protein [Rickettsiales bacterium]
MHALMVNIGNYLFRYRNRVFPLIIIALFAIAPPPSEILGSPKLDTLKDMLAFFITLSGLALRGLVIGYAYIKRGGLNKKVYAEHLVTQGLFSLCRNPLYVGNMLIYIGIFLMHGNPWITVTGIALFAFIYQCIIYAEERYLLEKFAEGYRAYCADVPRWGIRISGFSAATSDMAFNFRRVVLKDYSTIANALITLSLTEIYEHVALSRPNESDDYWLYLTGGIVLCLGAAVMVRWMKKTQRLVEYPAGSPDSAS